MRLTFFCLALSLAPIISQARAAEAGNEVLGPPIPPPGRYCQSAIEVSEKTSRIPYHLLNAIGRVESGRPDPRTGAWLPWPWTVNVEGQGYFFETKEAAIAAVREVQARGAHSIDVGCMQVNLQHHPNAFTSLDQAFDPQTNAAYAGQFLRALFQQTNDWARSAAYYHSQTPEFAEDYGRKVISLLPPGTLVPATFVKGQQPRPVSPVDRLAAAWAATMETSEKTGSPATLTASALRRLADAEAAPKRTFRNGPPSGFAATGWLEGRRERPLHGAVRGRGHDEQSDLEVAQLPARINKSGVDARRGSSGTRLDGPGL